MAEWSGFSTLNPENRVHIRATAYFLHLFFFFFFFFFCAQPNIFSVYHSTMVCVDQYFTTYRSGLNLWASVSFSVNNAIDSL